MVNWREILVLPKSTILETMQIIDRSASQIAIVVDETNTLLGTVTDGDIRRGILRGIALHSSIAEVMNPDPVYIYETEKDHKAQRMFRKKKLRQLPIVNERKKIVDVLFLDDFIDKPLNDHAVVLMAGGLGSRLRPLTNDIPKPMLQVGSKPILETIMESFIEHGFQKFYFSVNYKREIIKNYFGDGLKWGVEIDYLEENTPLGTAGALSLLPAVPNKPLIVMNGDLLTKVNFQQLLDFHEESDSLATMCVREYEHQIPYGIVKTEGQQLVSIEEKPTQKHFVNAGIYVLSPEILKNIPNNKYYDMPTLFKELLNNDQQASVFPIREYWLDIGRMNDFEKANHEFFEVFK